MKVLITGAHGMLASDLKQQIQKESWEAIALGKDELNITDSSSVEQQLKQHQPDVVVNCAAYTQVDQAESDQKQAQLINEVGPQILAENCSEHQIHLVHVSTDFVFDGTKNTPYLEGDSTHPLGVYGQTKLDGEHHALKNGALVVRTSWLYGEEGKNFVKTMLRLAGERPELNVVDDQIGSPTWTMDLAAGIVALIQKKATGIVHFSNQGQCTWYELAKEAIQLAFQKGHLTQVPVIAPIPSSQYPVPAKRPAYSVLDCGHYQHLTGKRPPLWKESLDHMLTRLLQNQ